MFDYFRRHYSHFFPALRSLHRTTFTRQAANLWQVKARLWQQLLRELELDRSLSLVDSFPLPICRFARARRCRHLTSHVWAGRGSNHAAPAPRHQGDDDTNIYQLSRHSFQL